MSIPLRLPQTSIFTRMEQLEIAVDSIVAEFCDEAMWETYAALPLSVKNLIITKCITVLNKNEEIFVTLSRGTDEDVNQKFVAFVKDFVPAPFNESLVEMAEEYWEQAEKSEKKTMRRLLMRAYLLVNK